MLTLHLTYDRQGVKKSHPIFDEIFGRQALTIPRGTPNMVTPTAA
jgi:hypothetical protein